MTDNNKQNSTFHLLIYFFLAVPISIFLFASYFEILEQSTSYMLKNHRNVFIIVWLLAVMAFIPFYSIAASFAWSAQQLGPKTLDPSDEQTVNKILFLAIYVAAALFIIFNILSIFVYLYYIKQNPFVENLLIQHVIGYLK